MDWARGMRKRVFDAGPAAAQIDQAYRLAYSRTPSADERVAALAFLGRQDKITGDRQKSFDDLCHMLLNSNEFVYLN
jgi:hypothetical protein